MTIKVYKSDFRIFEGLYNAVVYLGASSIVERCKNFITVDFGAEHMNPYTIRENKHIQGEYSYNCLERALNDPELEPELKSEITELLKTYRYATDRIIRKLNAAIAYPVGHTNRTLI
ncbi:MAG: hypothetical protein LBC68_12920 [Prevotellaceae bacterium]|jgi:hypothetical protein|nr:hypothetical protein [Prevotellaceae bacterium]